MLRGFWQPAVLQAPVVGPSSHDVGVAAPTPPLAQPPSSPDSLAGDWSWSGVRTAGAVASALAVLAASRPAGGRPPGRRSGIVCRAVDEDGWGDDEPAFGDDSTVLSGRAPLLIDGQTMTTEDTFEVRCPANGNLVGLAPNATEILIDTAVVAAHRAASQWHRTPNPERQRLLSACAAAIRSNLEALAILQTNESGRPIVETRIELFVAAACFDNAAKLLNVEGHEEEILCDNEKRVVTRRSPIGVVAVIAPWNAPVVLGWKPTSTALACGNTVVLKPAPQTPLTTLRIGELLRPLLPPGVLNVVVGKDVDVDVRPGEVLTEHPLVRKVVFTGSTKVGSAVMAACSKDFKRVLLELGGNDAAVVCEDCDIPLTVEGLFKGAFFNNGQTCCAAKRIYVHHKIFDEFVEAFVARCRRARLGNGLNEDIELGPLASDVQLQHVTDLVLDAREAGGEIKCGGGPIAAPPGDESSTSGLFYLPTIVVGVHEGTRLVDEEQFGPVVPVMPYKDEVEAVRRANSTKYGLGASVWSKDIAKANRIADELVAGTVWVNRHCEFVRNAPFGGFGESGVGRAGDLAQRDLSEYTELRTLVLGRVKGDLQAVPVPIVEVEDQARQMLQQRLGKIKAQLLEDPDAFENEAREAVRTFPLQPVKLRTALKSLAEVSGPPCLIVRNLPAVMSSTDAADAEPGRREPKRDSANEALIMGFVSALGARVYGFQCGSATADGEGLLREMQLVDGAEALGWHRSGRREPAYDPPRHFHRPEAIVPEFETALYMGSGTSGGLASVTIVDSAKLCAACSEDDLGILKTSPLAFFDNHLGQRTEQICVVADSEEEGGPPIIDMYQANRFEPEGHATAVAAYERICKAAESVQESYELQAGDLLVLNNKRCLHRWSTPSGSNAWLQVAYGSRAAKDWPDRVAH